MTKRAAAVVGLTQKEKEQVTEIRDEIMAVVDDFVPASDATRIEQDLDLLIKVLSRAAGGGRE